MEPNEFDQLINDKLSQENDLYQKEILDSQSFIWGEIQKQTNTKVFSIAWYVAAAAILLLIISSSIFLKMEYNSSKKIELLSSKVEQINNNSKEVTMFTLRNEELTTLCNELKILENSVAQLREKKPSVKTVIQNQLVYQTDTVFLTKIEYIVQEAPVSKENQDPIPTIDIDTPPDNLIAEDIIFLTENASTEVKNSLPIKLRFSNFSSNK